MTVTFASSIRKVMFSEAVLDQSGGEAVYDVTQGSTLPVVRGGGRQWIGFVVVVVSSRAFV